MVSKPDVEKHQELRRAAVLSVARKIATSAAATRTAPPEQPAAPRSIFKAKTTPQPASASAVPQTAGARTATAMPSPGQPATPHAVGPSNDRIQIPAGDGRVTLNPTATLVFGSHQEVLEYSSAGTVSFQELVLGATQEGEVIFYVPVGWKFPPAGNRPADTPLVGTGLAHVRVPFSVGADKDKPDQLAITWQSARTVALKSEGGGATLSGAPVTTDPTPNGGAATITPTVQFQEQLSHATTHSSVTMSHATTATVSIGFLGSGGSMAQTEQVTHDLSPGHQDQSQVNVTDSFTLSFTANVVLPKPEPVQVTSQLEVRFAVNSDSTASGGEEEKITTWYQTLDKKLRTSIESGKTKINLLGKASATGSFDHNRKLAERRLGHVKDILQDLAGSDATFHTQALGRSQPHHKGEDPDERVVIVTLGDNRPATVVSDEATPESPPEKQPGR
jgi:outer membrane protein OmpA-like peptidoglycan-associated protein